jgi:hypothetical protein
MSTSLTNATFYANASVANSTSSPNSNNLFCAVRSTSSSYSNVRVGYGDSGDKWQGTISEILIFTKAVSVSERQQIEGYLAHKWGLVNSLPASHPYKKFRN